MTAGRAGGTRRKCRFFLVLAYPKRRRENGEVVGSACLVAPAADPHVREPELPSAAVAVDRARAAVADADRGCRCGAGGARPRERRDARRLGRPAGGVAALRRAWS